MSQDSPLSSQIHPDFFSRMQHLMIEEYPAFMESLSEPSRSGLRVNALKLTPQAYQALAPFELSPIPWCSHGFLLSVGAQPGKHPHHAAGLYYLQEPSAMAVAEIVSPLPGERVLDLSAAPGGKTTHLAALMQNQGLIIANEIHPKRVWDLAENLERCGIRNAVITNETPERLAVHFGAYFDRVLVDAPCSGEGMFRKSEAARSHWNPDLVQGCALRQQSVLSTASRLVKAGGRLVYSTCTFSPEENERVIVNFLDEHSDFSIIPPPNQPGFSPGRPAWVQSDKYPLEHTVRIWPHNSPSDGHFIACLQRRESSGTPYLSDQTLKTAGLNLPQQLATQFNDFCLETLSNFVFQNRLTLVGSYLYHLPEGLPSLKNLKVIHPGWWLGVFKKNRFEPSHAFALGLTINQIQRTLNFSSDDPTLLAYLRGEGFHSPGDNGWLIITIDNFPLGWGKRTQGLIKNVYPHGLRWK